MKMNILCLTSVDHVGGIKERLSALGKLIYAPSLTGVSDIRDIIRLEKINILYVSPNKQKYILSENILGNTNIKAIVTVSRGVNHIDMNYCSESNISVVHLNKDVIAGQNSATAEHALGLTLALLKKIPQSFDAVKSGQWDYELFIGHQLKSLIVGVIGLGTLGLMYATYCRAIGSTVLECHRQNPDSFENVMSCADVISLHIPSTENNYHIIGKESIDMIKPQGCFIVNTSRGEIVDEEVIINGLRSGIIRGYATDVLGDEKEDISNNPIVVAAKEGLNVIITPHIAGTCFESAEIAHNRAIDLLRQKYD